MPFGRLVVPIALVCTLLLLFVFDARYGHGAARRQQEQHAVRKLIENVWWDDVDDSAHTVAVDDDDVIFGVSAMRRVTVGPRDAVYFLHVPKAGGMTFQSEVLPHALPLRHCGGYRAFHDDLGFARVAASTPSAACNYLYYEGTIADARHFTSPQLDPLHVATMLREPVSHRISAWGFERRNCAELQFVRGSPLCQWSLERRYRQPLEFARECRRRHQWQGWPLNTQISLLLGEQRMDNVTARTLLRDPGVRRRALRALADDVFYFGIIEYWAASVCLLLYQTNNHDLFEQHCARLCAPTPPAADSLLARVVNKLPDQYLQHVNLTTDTMRRVLVEELAPDRWLYEHARRIFVNRVQVVERETGYRILTCDENVI